MIGLEREESTDEENTVSAPTSSKASKQGMTPEQRMRMETNRSKFVLNKARRDMLRYLSQEDLSALKADCENRMGEPKTPAKRKSSVEDLTSSFAELETPEKRLLLQKLGGTPRKLPTAENLLSDFNKLTPQSKTTVASQIHETEIKPIIRHFPLSDADREPKFILYKKTDDRDPELNSQPESSKGDRLMCSRQFSYMMVDPNEQGLAAIKWIGVTGEPMKRQVNHQTCNAKLSEFAGRLKMVVLGTFDARGTTLPYLHACLNSALTDEAALHKNQNVMTDLRSNPGLGVGGGQTNVLNYMAVTGSAIKEAQERITAAEKTRDYLTKKPIIPCPYDTICKQTYGFLSHLVSHLHDKHSETFNGVECEVCGKLIGRLDSLDRHMQIHTGENKVECPKCHKEFARHDILKTHLETGACPATKKEKTKFHCPVPECEWSSVNSFKSLKEYHWKGAGGTQATAEACHRFTPEEIKYWTAEYNRINGTNYKCLS